MANTSLKAVFERFWQHVQLALEPKADKTALGSLEDLTTENKENLVAAINETTVAVIISAEDIDEICKTKVKDIELTAARDLINWTGYGGTWTVSGTNAEVTTADWDYNSSVDFEGIITYTDSHQEEFYTTCEIGGGGRYQTTIHCDYINEDYTFIINVSFNYEYDEYNINEEEVITE